MAAEMRRGRDLAKFGKTLPATALHPEMEVGASQKCHKNEISMKLDHTGIAFSTAHFVVGVNSNLTTNGGKTKNIHPDVKVSMTRMRYSIELIIRTKQISD